MSDVRYYLTSGCDIVGPFKKYICEKKQNRNMTEKLVPTFEFHCDCTTENDPWSCSHWMRAHCNYITSTIYIFE